MKIQQNNSKIQLRGNFDIRTHTLVKGIYYISKIDLSYFPLIATICKYNQAKVLHLKI